MTNQRYKLDMQVDLGHGPTLQNPVMTASSKLGNDRYGTSLPKLDLEIWPEGSARRWPAGGGCRKRHGYGRGDCVVASIRCSWLGLGFVSKNHYPRFTGVPFHHFRKPLTRPRSVDWG